MIDQPKPVEKAVVELLHDGLIVEADELIERHGLSRYEMLALAFPNPNLALHLDQGENHE